MDRPVMTIVTPSLNRGEHIARALRSVEAQGPAAIEHIVCDGGSTDDTHQVLAGFPSVKAMVQPDDSSHHALNNGIAAARGDIVGFLNTDDWYELGALASVIEILRARPDADMVCGAAAFHEQPHGQVGAGPRFAYERRHRRGPGRLEEITFGVPAFNSYFFRRHVFDLVGSFDVAYTFAADRDFLLRCFGAVKMVVTDRRLYNYLVHSGSRTMSVVPSEALEIAKQHVEIADAHLDRNDLSRHTQKVLADWRAYESRYSASAGFQNKSKVGKILFMAKRSLTGRKSAKSAFRKSLFRLRDIGYRNKRKSDPRREPSEL